ncbi:MAG: response regulator [Gallionellaceae bacterium]|nr:response regulator [Gallionellaceae bacterium]
MSEIASMGEKILVVDDDEFIRLVTQTALEGTGYKVTGAEDGLDAWEKIDADPSAFDLMLLDKQMPRMDGITLLRRIKSDDRFVNLPIVMLTGAAGTQDVAEGLANGAHYYLIKPSPEEILKLTIRNTLDEFRSKRELREMAGRQKNSLRILRRAEFSFRTLTEARELALWLAEASENPARTVNGYSELLINAVEHGNLGISYADKSRLLSEERWASEVEARLADPAYANRQVSVVMEKTGTDCKVTISDQGAGFDWEKYIEFSPERAFDLHGRGIAMSKMMSFDSLQYVGNGNTVTTMIKVG